MLIAYGPIRILENLPHAVEASTSFFEHPFQRTDRELLTWYLDCRAVQT